MGNGHEPCEASTGSKTHYLQCVCSVLIGFMISFHYTAVFRTLYADILEQINPDDIAAELYSKSLISLADREDVDNLMHSGHSRATVLLNAVERAVKADHNNVMIFVEVLHCIPKYKELAIKLCKAFH